LRTAEQGFLLLTSFLGNPERRPLTQNQLGVLTQRSALLPRSAGERELVLEDLLSIGYGREMAYRILSLLSEDALLQHYLHKGSRHGCIPLTRITEGYPGPLRLRLGDESPGCLWAKGDISILALPRIALVGSRDILPENASFAREVGRQAAKQGYALVSGNARGADRIAQEACLALGGKVISVVADRLWDKKEQPNVLYLSEEDYDEDFSSLRALRRNRVIHALGEMTFVAQCGLKKGGTWSGTEQNLKCRWSPVYCFSDGSAAVAELAQMGAETIHRDGLEDLRKLRVPKNLFDQ
jgi:predicted Rossmann fold nucleotide-binding protein DprA/Smf involved in DNA uptake